MTNCSRLTGRLLVVVVVAAVAGLFLLTSPAQCTRAADELCAADSLVLDANTVALVMGREPESCEECEEALPHLNAALANNSMNCARRAAAFLATVRHETAGLISFIQPIDNGAGAFHMLPTNARVACESLPSLQDDLAERFSHCVPQQGESVCSCGADIDFALVIAKPSHAWNTAAWWMNGGAAAIMGNACVDLLAAADVGIGVPAPSPSDREGATGFHLVSKCIFGFAADAGMAQRLQYYNHAVEVLQVPSRPGVSITHYPTNSNLFFEINFSEAVTGFNQSSIRLSSGMVAALSASQGGASYQLIVQPPTDTAVESLTIVVPPGAATSLATGYANVQEASLEVAVAHNTPTSIATGACENDGYRVTAGTLAAFADCRADTCTQFLEPLNDALLVRSALCPWRAAAILSQMRHDSAALSVFGLPSHYAGALHLSPANQRLACTQLSDLRAAALEGASEGCAAAGEAGVCDCISDAVLAEAVARPQLAFGVATWYIATGAALAHGEDCQGLLAATDIGYGNVCILVCVERRLCLTASPFGTNRYAAGYFSSCRDWDVQGVLLPQRPWCGGCR